MERIIVYIDGFNLYYGIKSKGWKDCYWLDLYRLAQNLLKPDQRLKTVHYFTSRISASSGNADKTKRQGTYLEALEAFEHRDLNIHYGKFQKSPKTCSVCQATVESHQEKMTDVNIAVQLLCDAEDDKFDTAILISGDSDLTPPVKAIRDRHPEKRVVIACPPDRKSNHLCQSAHASFPIGRNKLKHSQLPGQVTKPDGFLLQRPPAWAPAHPDSPLQADG